MGFVLVGIGCTSIFRIISLALWLSFVSGEPGSYATFVFNRLTWISFFLTFMVLVFGWIESVHSKYPPPSDRFRPVFMWTMVIVGSFAVAAQVVTMICALVFGGKSSRVADDAAIWTFNAFLILLSLAFLGYGSALLYKLKRTSKGPLVQMNEAQVNRQRRVFVRIVLVMSVLSGCCLLKVATLMTRPLGFCFPLGWFWTTAYMVPEIVSATLEMFVVASTFESKGQDSDAEQDSRSAAIPLLRADSHAVDDDDTV